MKNIFFSVLFFFTASFVLGQNLDSGLVAYYPFSGNANDATGNGNNGTVFGATLTADRYGNPNHAYSFNGQSSHIRTNTLAINNQISIFVWLYDLGGVQGYYINPRIISGEYCNGGYALFRNHINSPTGILFTRNRCGPPGSDYFSYVDYSLNNWHHVGITYNGSTCLFYLDDSLVASVTQPGDIIKNSTYTYIGRSGCTFEGKSDNFYGILDDIRIYDRAITQTEVTLLYNQGPGNVTLLSPANNSTNLPLTPTLIWLNAQNAIGYKVKISSNSTFSAVTDSATVTTNQYAIPSGKLNYNTKYYWKVAGFDSTLIGRYSEVWNFTTNPTTGNNNISNEIPSVFILYENYPNPFNPTTSIKYDIASNSYVKLVVFDVTGKVVETLVNGNLQAGKYEVTFNGGNYSSGIYFVKMEAGSYNHIVKMIMVK